MPSPPSKTMAGVPRAPSRRLVAGHADDGDLRMSDVGHSPMVRAAFAYFVEDLGQSEIAARLGVSRATVHNYLRQARDEGLVRISLDPAILSRSRAAAEIGERFGLEKVYIVPTEEDGPALEGVARAAAMWLEELLAPEDTLGIAWGETIHRLATLLPRRSLPRLSILQLVGSMALPFRFTAESCTSLVADRFGALCVNLHAPAVLSNADLVAALCREPIIARHIERFAQCDAALFAVGLALPESHVVQCGVATLEELAFYQARNATAVIAGRFIDGQGEPVEGPLDGRIIGIELDRLRAVRKRIVVSAGLERAPALRAALSGGFATHLITDAASATYLLDL